MKTSNSPSKNLESIACFFLKIDPRFPSLAPLTPVRLYQHYTTRCTELLSSSITQEEVTSWLCAAPLVNMVRGGFSTRSIIFMSSVSNSLQSRFQDHTVARLRMPRRTE